MAITEGNMDVASGRRDPVISVREVDAMPPLRHATPAQPDRSRHVAAL